MQSPAAIAADTAFALALPEALASLGSVPLILLVIAATTAAAIALKLLASVVAWYVDETGASLPALLFDVLSTPIARTLVLGGVYVAVRIAELPMLGFYLEGALLSALVVVWGVAAVRLGHRLLHRLSEDAPGSEVAPVLSNVWSAVVVLVALFSLLNVWRVDVTPLLASASVVGIVIGLAAQDAIANFVGGLALFADDTYKPGDFVVLDSGEKGTVTDIGLRATTIVTLDRVEVTIPNAVLNSTHVTNESAPQRYKRIRVPVGVAYDSDLDRVEAALLDAMRSEEEVLDNPRPRVHFREFGDSALQFECRAFIHHPAREAPARDALNERIHRTLADADIEIPFPQRTLTFGDDLSSSESDSTSRESRPRDGVE
ncbi:Mechanosensitive ion channel [Natronoarchaeum philippinense]|uniref:Mechanosensitive ion channel n=1 Tax=Natronoarchaeum philippinense TaxID=558529 RepID=A0A285P486_NATPI|nr:mechanosensitive ion channel family protein [Natronoarchaeum philippinense]SNZ14966.1 Mechanosensitive ion channel [Natronoarchaeum philippinense]